MEDRLLKIDDVIACVGIGRSKIFQMVKQNEFVQPVKIGGTTLWSHLKVQEFIANIVNNGKLN